MKTLLAPLAAVATVAMLAQPSQPVAGELPPAEPGQQNFGNFVSALARPPLPPIGQMRIVGAKVFVIHDDMLKLIEYTTEGSTRITAQGPRVTMEGKIQPQYIILDTPSACSGPDEPVLARGTESSYDIEWCDASTPTAPHNDSAKKNYYYLFSSGDYQLVLTIEFDCENEDDRSQMPQAVIDGACESL